jgi:DNA-binding response OmpR family regulator
MGVVRSDTRHVRSSEDVVAAVALTAYGRLTDRAQILAAGYDECLTKPIAVHELVAVLRRLAGR